MALRFVWDVQLRVWHDRREDEDAPNPSPAICHRLWTRTFPDKTVPLVWLILSDNLTVCSTMHTYPFRRTPPAPHRDGKRAGFSLSIIDDLNHPAWEGCHTRHAHHAQWLLTVQHPHQTGASPHAFRKRRISCSGRTRRRAVLWFVECLFVRSVYKRQWQTLPTSRFVHDAFEPRHPWLSHNLCIASPSPENKDLRLVRRSSAARVSGASARARHWSFRSLLLPWWIAWSPDDA